MTIRASAALRGAAFLAALLLAPGAFAGFGVPKGEAAFTAWMAKRIQAQLPAARVEVDSPLTLKVRQADGEEILQANLDRIFDFCTRSPAHCEDAASQYTSGIAEHLAGREDALEAPMVASRSGRASIWNPRSSRCQPTPRASSHARSPAS